MSALLEVMVALPDGTLREPQRLHTAIYGAFCFIGRPRDFLFKGLNFGGLSFKGLGKDLGKGLGPGGEVCVVRARSFRGEMADQARPIPYTLDRDVYDFHLTAAPQYRDHATQKLRFLPVVDVDFSRHRAWLERKGAECGFGLIGDAGLDRRVLSVPQKGGLAIDHCEFSGRLRVIDHDRFKAALEHGIGPRAGYGYGLLSLY